MALPHRLATDFSVGSLWSGERTLQTVRASARSLGPSSRYRSLGRRRDQNPSTLGAYPRRASPDLPEAVGAAHRVLDELNVALLKQV